MSPCQSCLVRAQCQPLGREYTTGKAFIKEMDLEFAGMVVPQHAHAYEHISYVARGSVLFEGRLIRAGTHEAAITVPAHKKHTFQSLEDDTLVLCIHDRQPVVTDENQITGVEDHA